MEQIQFIYFQYYIQCYTVHYKENSTYMEIWHRGWWFKLHPQLPVCFGFTIVTNNVTLYGVVLHPTYWYSTCWASLQFAIKSWKILSQWFLKFLLSKAINNTNTDQDFFSIYCLCIRIHKNNDSELSKNI